MPAIIFDEKIIQAFAFRTWRGRVGACVIRRPASRRFFIGHAHASGGSAAGRAAASQRLRRRLIGTPPLDRRHGAGLIAIDVGRGRRIRVDAQVDAKALAIVLDALDRRR